MEYLDSDTTTPRHVIVDPLRVLIEEALGDGVPPAGVAQLVLDALSAAGLVRYPNVSGLSLLAPRGRVLVAVLEHPTMTLQEMAFYLGTSETAVSRDVSTLVRSKLITRTKTGTRSTYRLNPNAIVEHPDLVRLLRLTLTSVVAAQGDITD